MEIPAGFWLDEIKGCEGRGARWWWWWWRDKAWYRQVMSPRQPGPGVYVNTSTMETIKEEGFYANTHTHSLLRLKPEVEVLTTLCTCLTLSPPSLHYFLAVLRIYSRSVTLWGSDKKTNNTERHAVQRKRGRKLGSTDSKLQSKSRDITPLLRYPYSKHRWGWPDSTINVF